MTVVFYVSVEWAMKARRVERAARLECREVEDVRSVSRQWPITFVQNAVELGCDVIGQPADFAARTSGS